MLELYVRSQGVVARLWIVKMERFRDSKGELKQNNLEPNFTRHPKYIVLLFFLSLSMVVGESEPSLA